MSLFIGLLQYISRLAGLKPDFTLEEILSLGILQRCSGPDHSGPRRVFKCNIELQTRANSLHQVFEAGLSGVSVEDLEINVKIFNPFRLKGFLSCLDHKVTLN